MQVSHYTTIEAWRRGKDRIRRFERAEKELDLREEIRSLRKLGVIRREAIA